MASLEEMLMMIAKWCIREEFYRTDAHSEDGFRHFDKKLIRWMAGYPIPDIEGGFTFLVKECKDTARKVGMIKLYWKGYESGPKWCFWTNDDGSVGIDYA